MLKSIIVLLIVSTLSTAYSEETEEVDYHNSDDYQLDMKRNYEERIRMIESRRLLVEKEIAKHNINEPQESLDN